METSTDHPARDSTLLSSDAIQDNLEPGGSIAEISDIRVKKEPSSYPLKFEVAKPHAPSTSPDKKNPETHPSVFSLDWCFGFNTDVGAINLTSKNSGGGRDVVVAYVSANVAVIHNVTRHTQQLLHAHCDAISQMVASPDGMWLMTADVGGTLMVWEVGTGYPVRSYFNAVPAQTLDCVAVSEDGRCLALISASGHGGQTLSLWMWLNMDDDRPATVLDIPRDVGKQRHVKFSVNSNHYLVSTSGSHVLFYIWLEGELTLTCHLTDTISKGSTLKKNLGLYTQSIFLFNTPTALTATTKGCVVMWESHGGASSVQTQRKSRKTLEKMIPKSPQKICQLQDNAICVLTQTLQFIVTGNVRGCVTFYTHGLQLLHTYQHADSSPVRRVTFMVDHGVTVDELKNMKKRNENIDDSDDSVDIMKGEEFVASSDDGHISQWTVGERGDGTEVTLVCGPGGGAGSSACVACHPTKDVLCVAGTRGRVMLYDQNTKLMLAAKHYGHKLAVTAAEYEQSGTVLALGFTSGHVDIVDGLTLDSRVAKLQTDIKTNITPPETDLSNLLHSATYPIQLCRFSPDPTNLHMATSDGSFAVTLYGRSNDSWTSLCRYRGHSQIIVGLEFYVKDSENSTRLVSLGKDLVLQEYDCEASKHGMMVLNQTTKLSQTADVTCMTLIKDPKRGLQMLLVNDDFKLKLFNLSEDRMCRDLMLGPTLASPIDHISLHDSEGHLLFTAGTMLGVLLLPLDGNPYRFTATLAHPATAHQVRGCHGNKVFTSGRAEQQVLMWSLNLTQLRRESERGGDGVQPYLGLLEADRPGELLDEMKQFFYYMGLKAQEGTQVERLRIERQISVEQVSKLMRALGHFPNEREIEEMETMIRHSADEDGMEVEGVDMATFIKLFINHRPVYGLRYEHVQRAFSALVPSSSSVDPAMDTSRLLEHLQTRGEKMGEGELAHHLASLMGVPLEGGGKVQEVSKHLPPRVSASSFCSNILDLNVKTPLTDSYLEMERDELQTKMERDQK